MLFANTSSNLYSVMVSKALFIQVILAFKSVIITASLVLEATNANSFNLKFSYFCLVISCSVPNIFTQTPF
jgi:hypothetical protein